MLRYGAPIRGPSDYEAQAVLRDGGWALRVAVLISKQKSPILIIITASVYSILLH